MLKFQAAIYGGSVDKPEALTVTFDTAFAALEHHPRMFIEPDGSFVLTGAAEEGKRWQVDGNLIDRGDVLAYVELKGSCPEKEFELLLRALGWPQSPLVFQLTQRGIVLDEPNFRRLAASENGAL
jgi:hypothetical protein